MSRTNACSRSLRRLHAVVVCLGALLLIAPAESEAQRPLGPGAEAFQQAGFDGIRGITVGPIESSQQAGRGYGTPYSAALLDHLAAMGVNWISLTPFGRLFSLDSTFIQKDFEAPYEENRTNLKRMIAQAHARGIRVLVIPHLWVETGGWRGEIELGTPERWETYQSSYYEFVMGWAKDAADAGADAFSIGVECKSWSGRFMPFWRRLIHDVRQVFPGLLTYSANWDEAEDVLFWEELDFIGVNAFYPLHYENDATYAQYVEGAKRAAENVAALAEIHQRPVLFVEIGYTTRANAAVEPWLWPDDMSNVVIDEAEQARAMAALFEAFLPHPWFAGFFVWRYYANLDDVSQEAIWGFSPHAKQAERLLVDTFNQAFGVDPAPWPWQWQPTRGLVKGAYPFTGLFPLSDAEADPP